LASGAELSIKSSVYPSGTALATELVPMVAPAPVRFSTTNGWPSLACSCSAKMRPVVSTAPPAAIGTTILTVRAG